MESKVDPTSLRSTCIHPIQFSERDLECMGDSLSMGDTLSVSLSLSLGFCVRVSCL